MSRRADPQGEPRAPESGRLFQEDLLGEPFWMLVACSLVNLTTWRQAKPAFEWLRATYPTPQALAAARPEDLHTAMQPLGLWRRRSESLVKMANAWLRTPPACAKDVSKMPGCGKYASDSWAIFVDGRRDVTPNDGKLSWYVLRFREAQNAGS